MFRHFRNVVSNLLKIAKCDCYTGMILESKNKPKLMWKCLKELLPGQAELNLKGLLVMIKLVLTQRALQMHTMNILPPLVMT